MKNPYFASRPPRVEDFAGKKTELILEESGANTGNLLFFAATRRVIAHTRPSGSMSFSPEYVREHHDGIIIPAANWLKASSDHTGLAALIEKANLPCVVIGLGAQSSDLANLPNLSAGTVRFLRAVSERSNQLSVRGPFTGEVLEKHGIKNYTVTGCPSLLWKISEPPTVEKHSRPLTHISLNGTRYDPNDQSARLAFLKKPDESSRVGLLMMKKARQHNFDYVAQTEVLDLKVSRGEAPLESGTPDFEYLSRIYHESDAASLRTFLAEHIKIYGDVQEWVDYLKTRDFVVGTRLHGVIASLLAGTPAALLTHDTRTEEMAITAGIPFVRSSEIGSDIDFQSVYDRADFAHFNKVQKSYYARFIDFLDKNNVTHKLNVNAKSLETSKQ